MSESIVERLKNIEDCLDRYEDGYSLPSGVDDIVWLIEQTKRTHEALTEILELSKHDGHSHYLDKCYVVARRVSEETKMPETNVEKAPTLNVIDYDRIIHALKFRREASRTPSHKKHMDKLIRKVELVSGRS